MEALQDAEPRVLQLLLLTSEWSGPADGIVRSRVEALLGDAGSLVQRVELRRESCDGREPTASAGGQWRTTTVDAAYVALSEEASVVAVC
jgi:hypothetical protein